jgi:hypothetical protein
MQVRYDRVTTTIEREWLAEIIAGTKKIEYRQIKPYWTRRGQGYIEQLEKPYPSRREIVGAGSRITGVTRKAVEDKRVAEGPGVAVKRSNVRGAKRPRCLQ